MSKLGTDQLGTSRLGELMGYPKQNVPSSGWYVEIDHPNGRVLRPAVVGKPQRNPKANDYPTISIPVRRDEGWQDSSFEDQPMRVWFDGVRQPIDELESVAITPGATVLSGRGGTELETHVTAEYTSEPIHSAAEALIDDNTTYTSNVDAPASTVETNVEVQSADTTSEFQDRVAAGDTSTDPVDIQSGQLDLLQSAFVAEGEDADSTSGTNVFSAGRMSGGDSIEFDASGDSASWNFTPDYTIPAAEVAVYVRLEANDSMEIHATLNGSTWDVLPEGSDVTLDWRDIANNPYDTNSNGYGGGDLEAGTQYTLTLDVPATYSSTGNPPVAVDVVAPLDKRFSYTFDNDNGGSSGFLDGPELFPDAHDVEFDDAVQVESVSGGRIESTWDDTSGSQQVAMSNDKGVTFPLTSANTDTHEADFSDLGASIRWRARLSRFGSRSTATPQQGFNGQSIQSYSLKADLDDTPLLVDQSFDAQLMGVLQEMADQGDFVFEYRRDGSAESVEWTQVGQRSSSKEPDVATYDVSKSTAGIVEKANVEGSSLTVRDESVTANHGTWVDLANDNLQSARERVESGGTVYQRDVDYEMDYDGGRIKTLSGGDISDGASLSVDYRYMPYNSYTADGISSPIEETFTIPGLTTERACGLVAKTIVDDLKDPRWEATVTIPHDETGWSVVDDITLPQVPTGGARHVNEVENAPAQTLLQLASREQIGEAVDDIRNRVQQNARKV